MMVVVIPRGVSLNQAVRYGVKHFLRIPFATKESTPQLLASIEQIAEVPISANLPRVAWNSPDQYFFSTGRLDLQTPARVKAAVALLKRFRAAYPAIAKDISSGERPICTEI